MDRPRYSITGRKTELEKLLSALNNISQDSRLTVDKRDKIQTDIVKLQAELDEYLYQVQANLPKLHNQIKVTSKAQDEFDKLKIETDPLMPFDGMDIVAFNKAIMHRQNAEDKMNIETKKLHALLPTECDWYDFPEIGMAVYSMNSLHAHIIHLR